MPVRALQAVASLLAPERCLSCRRRATLPWCDACATEVRPLAPGCGRCASSRGGPHHCWPAGSPVDSTIAVHDYRGPVARAVVTAKVAGAHAGWAALAALLAERLAEERCDADVVTWVTTAPGRARRRGGDHAEVLARAVARRLALPSLRLLSARVGPEGRDRYQAVRELPGTEVLLVDDVLTTGATATRAAATLAAAGAGRVHLAVLARAGSHDLVGPRVGASDR